MGFQIHVLCRARSRASETVSASFSSQVSRNRGCHAFAAVGGFGLLSRNCGGRESMLNSPIVLARRTWGHAFAALPVLVDRLGLRRAAKAWHPASRVSREFLSN